MTFKQILSRGALLLLAVALVLTAFAGCARSEDESEESYDEKDYPKYVNEDGYEFTTMPVTLSVWYNSPKSMGGNWGDDYVTAWIKDTLNLTLDIRYATTGGSEELNTMLIAGDKLPDMLVLDPYSSIARQMIDQKYVLALDEAAEEYYPDFMKIIPGGMKDVFSSTDGHFYHTAGWYADPERVQEIRQEYNLNPGAGDQSLSLNRKYYEEMNSPKLDTPDQLFDYLDALHKKYPDITMPVVPYIISWGHTKDSVNFFYRMFGGADWLYEDNGSIKICVNDPKYKQALQFMNRMYRAGLFTKEVFSGAYDIITTTLRSMKTFAYIGQDWQWFSLVRDGDKLNSQVMPIEMPAGVSRDQLSLKDLTLSTTGGDPAVFISKDSKKVQRAIEYLAFRYTDESQIAERFGIEGKSWERDPDNGMISWTQEVKDFEAENGWQAGSEKYGYNNGLHSWFTTIAITMLESTNTRYPIQQYNGELNGKYAKDERIYDLTKKAKDEDTQIMLDLFVKAANESVVKCLQADTEAAFEEEYSKYVTLAKNSKQADLEAYFTQQYQYWKGKGF